MDTQIKTTIEIYKDEYDGRYKADWQSESSVRDRSVRGCSTLRAARRAAEDRAYLNGIAISTKYIGTR